MIFLQIIFIISTLVTNISCTTLEELEEKFVNLQQYNSHLEASVQLLKDTVYKNQATIQVLEEEVEVLKHELNLTKIDTRDKFEDLNQANENIQTEVAVMNSQIQDLELMAVAETCLEIANHGLTVSKEYDLDFDGVNRGQAPIKGGLITERFLFRLKSSQTGCQITPSAQGRDLAPFIGDLSKTEEVSEIKLHLKDIVSCQVVSLQLVKLWKLK